MKRKITLQLLTLLLAFQFANAQTTITVDNTPGSNAQYSDLQIAISNANGGDILYVQPSEVNYGTILVDKPLTFLGFGHGGEKETLIRDILFGDAASNCTFRGLHITNNFRVQTDDANITLTNLVIENCRIDGLTTFHGGGVDNMMVRGNIIWRFGSTGNYTNTLITNNIITGFIRITNHQSVTVKNNLFFGSATVGNAADDTGTVTVQNSIFYRSNSATYNPNSTGVTFENCLTYNREGLVETLEGANNLDRLDPIFVATNNNDNFEAMLDDYHLQPSSPAIGAGVSGEDIGLYGGGDFVFNNLGLTSDIPTVRIEAISNAVAPGENIDVTISTNAH